MSDEILHESDKITSWLDCVYISDVNEYFSNYFPSILYKNSVRREIEYSEDSGKPKFEIKFYYKNENKPHIMYLGEFGPVDSVGNSAIATSACSLGIYKYWCAIVRKVNEGVFIDGKTYDEALRDFYQEQNRKHYAPQIKELQEKLQGYYRLIDSADDALEDLIREYQSSELGD